ncbi:MAG TPA: DUF1990 family protein [Polyangia bacterium]|nr:DUF1990 family protein [Polyangia bacterium]
MERRIPEWRFGRGWTDEELSARLGAVDAAAEVARARSEPAGRQRDVASSGPLGREAAGAPEPGGLFARACDLLVAYELSDPRIVAPHFDRAAPLASRPILLEIKVLGFRYLCPVVVGDVMSEPETDRTRFGFRVDTVVPHLERGSEWFIVEKDHRTGAVRFSITARWEPGQFPDRWSRVGFAVLARRYQRAWHRRAHRRLRDRLNPGAVGPGRGGAAFWATVARVGAVAGLRSMLAPAAVSLAFDRAGASGHGRGGEALASPASGLILPVLAAGELVADKLPAIPARTAAAPLAGRVLAAAWAASAIAAESGRRPRARAFAAALGAATAVAAAFAGYHLRRWARRRTRLPDAVVAVAEDALALTLAFHLVPPPTRRAAETLPPG